MLSCAFTFSPHYVHAHHGAGKETVLRNGKCGEARREHTAKTTESYIMRSISLHPRTNTPTTAAERGRTAAEVYGWSSDGEGESEIENNKNAAQAHAPHTPALLRLLQFDFPFHFSETKRNEATKTISPFLGSGARRPPPAARGPTPHSVDSHKRIAMRARRKIGKSGASSVKRTVLQRLRFPHSNT